MREAFVLLFFLINPRLPRADMTIHHFQKFARSARTEQAMGMDRRNLASDAKTGLRLARRPRRVNPEGAQRRAAARLTGAGRRERRNRPHGSGGAARRARAP
jgi:hypothetical protein